MSYVVKSIAEKWYKLLEVPREFDESFAQLLKNEGGFTEMKFEDFDREANKDKYARNVIWALYFCEEVSKKYKEKGIPGEIMLDTLFDIKNRIIRSTGELGYFCLKGLDTWFWLHLSFKLFKVGCLQYQLRGAEGGAEHLGLAEGENVLALHIPKGTSIKKRDVLASFDAANRFFEKYFPEYEYKFFTCHSWLIDKTLNKFLEPDSNIITFQNLFTYACQTPLDSAITFCFPYGVTRENIKDFAPKTSLQAKIRNHVLRGGELYYSFGIRKK